MRTQWYSFALCATLACATGLTLAAEGEHGEPYAVINNTTDRVLAEIKEATTYFDNDPQRFYDRIDTILTEVTDFYSFSRSVMGVYASNRAMRALDDAGKKKLTAQVERFVDKFHTGLVQTYAKGLLNFSGERIEVVKPDSTDTGDSAIIDQLIYGEAPQPYTVQYKMRRDRDGEWKVRNVTIESINLGKVFRSQFASEARKYDGDLDQVIENWSSEAAAKEVEQKRGTNEAGEDEPE